MRGGGGVDGWDARHHEPASPHWGVEWNVERGSEGLVEGVGVVGCGGPCSSIAHDIYGR